MSEVKFKGLWRVDIIESERGWGSKIDESKYFNTKEEASKFSSEYNNTYNTSSTVPDWYMYADTPLLIK